MIAVAEPLLSPLQRTLFDEIETSNGGGSEIINGMIIMQLLESLTVTE